jgi:hypothetical protein
VIPLAASQREAAPEQVRSLWTDLLARLSLAAVASTQPQARLQLCALGVRRTGTVATILARELLMTHRMAAHSGVWVRPLELQRRVGELAHPGTLVCHLRGLAAAYQDIMLDSAMPLDKALAKWIADRQHVHWVQIESLEKLAD